MAEIVFAEDINHGWILVNGKIREHGISRPSERGMTRFIPDLLLVVARVEEEPISHFLYTENPNEIWIIKNENGKEETYKDRIGNQMDHGINLIKKYPYSRRFSISISRPWDILSPTPPSLMEVYVQVIDREVHLTGFFRSLDTYNYLKLNLLGLSEIQREICEKTGYKPGTIAAMMVNAHYYVRDENFLEDTLKSYDQTPRGPKEVNYIKKHAKLIRSKNIPFGWWQTLEYVFYEGFEDKTQWGEVFEKQSRAKFGHRMLIEIEDPLKEMMDDKATFTRKYGEEYAMRYVIGEGEVIVEEGESYTYASRARCEKRDLSEFKKPTPDQISRAIDLLRKNKYTRRAAVNISRPWDILMDDPACLRAYVFQAIDDVTLGITLFMRSNDAYGATYANQYAFARLAEFVAGKTGFSRVKMTLLSANMHIYGDSWDAVQKMLRPDMPTVKEMLGL
ncbi:MAG: thymidylate synthase [Candidatus Syntropharchaeia archaeon]